MCETDQQPQLLVCGSQVRDRIADREDPQQFVSWTVQRDEYLVVRMPGVRVYPGLALGDVAVADVVSPVEFAVFDDVRAAAEETVVEQVCPPVPAVRAAEEGTLRLLVPVHGRDAEVVPFAAVEVEHDGVEPEHLRDGSRN